MKYLKHSTLLIAFMAFNLLLFGQEPCTELTEKLVPGEVIEIPTTITPVHHIPTGDLHIACPQDISVNVEQGQTGADVFWDDAIYERDPNCPDPTVTLTQGAGQAVSGSYFEAGEYSYTYIAKDNCGNEATCAFTIWVGSYEPVVIFVHGKGGDDTSWEQASQYTTQNFNAERAQVTYNEDDGLIASGTSLNDNILNKVTPLMPYNPDKNLRKKNFIVSHSQGGIVSQYAEMNIRNSNIPINTNASKSWDEEIFYGGIVTFASPHKGAYGLNSLLEDENGIDVFDDGDDNTHTRFETFFKDATTQLSLGPITEIENMFPEFMGIDTKVSGLITTIVNLVADKVPKVLVGGAMNNTTRGYITNPVVSQSINVTKDFFDGNSNPTDPIPKIAFYGVVTPAFEMIQGELIWRTAFWAQNSPNGYTTQNDVFFGSAVEGLDPVNGLGLDGQYQANQVKNEYLAKQELNGILANWVLNSATNFMESILIRNRVYELTQAEFDLKQGVLWFNTANDKYKTLIGVKTYEVASCECECNKEFYGLDDPFIPNPTIHLLDNCNSSCSQFESMGTNSAGDFWEVACIKVVHKAFMNKESDGMVLAESASYIAGATVNETSPRPDGQGDFTKADFVLNGSVHMQMRNDMNMREKLEGVKIPGSFEWDKGLYRGYYDNYFKID